MKQLVSNFMKCSNRILKGIVTKNILKEPQMKKSHIEYQNLRSHSIPKVPIRNKPTEIVLKVITENAKRVKIDCLIGNPDFLNNSVVFSGKSPIEPTFG